jgi:hypothetical protein
LEPQLASLHEQRRFELPVLFGLFPFGKATENQPTDRSESDSLNRLQRSGTAEIRVFAGVRNHKENRRFEFPPLHQRGTANRSLLCVAAA